MFLLGQLLCAGLNRLVQGQNFGRQLDGALADLLELVDGAEEFLMFRETNILNLSLAVFSVVAQALDEGVRPVANASIFEEGYELVEEV